MGNQRSEAKGKMDHYCLAQLVCNSRSRTLKANRLFYLIRRLGEGGKH